MVKLSSVLKKGSRFFQLLCPQTNETIPIDYLWLRDHCRCDTCYDSRTHQITSNLLHLMDKHEPAELSHLKDSLKIKWNDGHHSTYSINWLIDAVTCTKNRKNVTFWDKKQLTSIIQNTKIKIPLETYLRDGGKSLLAAIVDTGIGFVTNVDPTLEATENVVKKITHVQKTFFGEFWEVTNDLYHDDLAYTNVALEAHTDNTYFTEAAGLQIFHMLSHDGNGGETVLVDGFNAANNLRSTYPDAFKLLCATPVGAEYIEDGVHYTNVDSVIKLHPITKELLQIRYNVRDRAVMNTIPQEDVREFYEAYTMFGKEVSSQQNEFRVKLAPGDVIFIDNWRVLHGRAAYTGLRRLCGCYLGRADWLSKAKALKVI